LKTNNSEIIKSEQLIHQAKNISDGWDEHKKAMQASSDCTDGKRQKIRLIQN